jgi:NADH-quinone oxidoreductase subunit L
MDTTLLLGGIIAAPLAGAIVLGLVGKRLGDRLVALLACGTVAVSFVLAVLSFGRMLSAPADAAGVRSIRAFLLPWITVGRFDAPFELTLDPLSGIYVLFVTFVGFLIHVFATGYMKGDAGYYRFFCYLNLFMFNMLVLVLGSNMLVMFVGWEGVGLCSYLLIGYYFRQEWPNAAAKKAFVVNRIGDVAFVLAIVLTYTIFESIDFASVGVQAAAKTVEALSWNAIFAGGLTTIAVLMFVGATGKSAQIPLFVWLPDAMAGPTPVSALIHAATMVTAGVYMVARTSHIYVKAPTAMLIVAIVGAATALVAATIGLAQWDIKKVLAYSTVSQLGYMFLACGVGAFGAGVFHVMTHAFFKALLFLGAGSVIVGMHHEQDMRRMGGLRRYMPVTHATMAVAWLAICGFPLLSGFFSKDEILYQAFITPVFAANVGHVLWLVGAGTALLTAVYMTRLMVLTFWSGERFQVGDPHSDSPHGDAHEGHGGTPHESPANMTVPLIVLAALAALGGYVGVPNGLGHLVGIEHSNYFEHFLEPALGQVAAAAHEPSASLELILTAISVIVALAGMAIGYVFFSKQPLHRMPKILEDKWRVDELYDAALIRPILVTSREVLWKIVDVRGIDGLVNAVGEWTRGLGATLRYLQSGLARAYAAVVLVGAALLVTYFVFFESLARLVK